MGERGLGGQVHLSGKRAGSAESQLKGNLEAGRLQ